MSKAVVLGGRGQVGSALVDVLSHGHEVYVDDLNEPAPVQSVDFLHVCIPFTEKFSLDVINAETKYKPKHIVIHSTVPVGTTRKIGYRSAHSPVRGQHDNLKEGIQGFVKYIGALNQDTAVELFKHYQWCGIKASIKKNPEETEAMKLLCLDRYLNDLAWYEHASKVCEKLGINRDILKDWTRTYNDGYEGSKFLRPELDFPNGKVGGHCVIPVSKMLYEQTKDEFTGKNLSLFGEGYEA